MTEYCRNCYQPIKQLFGSTNFPWIHAATNHPRCRPYQRATPSDHINCLCPNCRHS